MNNKRGQGLSTNAIILIILGIVVLVILIAGFTVGWGKIAPFLSSENVNSVVTQCQTACSTNGVFAFCSTERELNDGTKKIKTNCATFSVISEYAKYGIEECPSLASQCDFVCENIKIGEKTASEKSVCDELTEDDITSIAKVETAGNKCCIAKQ